jgi:hypothetical protein
MGEQDRPLRGTILTTQELAKALDWDTRKTRRWLQRSEACVKVGSRYVTTPSLLANHFPELWQEIAFDVGEGRLL